MRLSRTLRRGQITRRMVLGGAATMAVAPALAEECPIGPPPHEKGPTVFMDYDQFELDAAYDQSFYAPLAGQIWRRLAAVSEAVRGRLGQPLRESYGPTAIEQLDIYRATRPNAPLFVTYGTNETPEFQRQSRDFAAAVHAAGKPAELVEAISFNHIEMVESLGNPYGPNGRAALSLMKLAST